MKIIVGLTGPTGAGKSTVCRVAEDRGYSVIDCDKLAREVTEQKDVLDALCNAFGNDILDCNKRLNRRALAQKAFSSNENTELLNRTILPYIAAVIKNRINESKTPKILLDAPTLFESGTNALCDFTVAVLSSPELRLLRIISRDNITNEQARLRMSAGKSDDYYKNRVDRILYNDTTEAELKNNFNKILTELEEM